MSGPDAPLSLFAAPTNAIQPGIVAHPPRFDGEPSRLMRKTGVSRGVASRSNGGQSACDGWNGSAGLPQAHVADLPVAAGAHSPPRPLDSVLTGQQRRGSLAEAIAGVADSRADARNVLDRRTSELLEQAGLDGLLDDPLVHSSTLSPSALPPSGHSASSLPSSQDAPFADQTKTPSPRQVPRSPPRASRTLSSAALAALADSPARPPRPPKSSARPSSRASFASSSHSGAATEGGDGVSPAASIADSPAGVDVAGTSRSPSLGEASSSHSSGLTFPRLRAGTASTDRTPALSTASSASARNSAVFYSSLEEEAEDDGEPWDAGTPATTIDYSSPALPLSGAPSVTHSPALDEHAALPAWKRPGRQVEPLQLHLAPPMSPSSTTDTLKGLGLNFFTASAGSASSTTVSSPVSVTVPPLLNEDDLDRELERLSQYAKSLPSPLPAVLARSNPSFEGLADWVTHDDDAGESVPDEKTLVVDPLRAGATRSVPVPPVPPLPSRFPSTHSLPLSRSREASAASPPSRRPSLLNLPNYHSAPSTRDYLSPGIGTADETDFVSTTDAGEDDDGEDDEGDDSFGFQSSTMRPPKTNAAARGDKATSLWNEDVAWRGSPAKGADQSEREGEDVVDWSDAPVEKRDLPRGG